MCSRSAPISTRCTPVSNRRPEPDLTWPLQHRVFMRGWDWLFFKEGTFAPDPQKSAEWNRGAYLVEGAGPLRRLPHAQERARRRQDRRGAARQSRSRTGSRPNLANDCACRARRVERRRHRRISQDRPQRPQRRHRPDGGGGRQFDLEADRRRLRSHRRLHQGRRSANPPDERRQGRIRRSVDAGKAIFADTCSACHQADGKGVPRMFPPLAHNANVQSADPTSVIRVILEGARTVATDARPTPSSMPAFGWKLDDDAGRRGCDLRTQRLGQHRRAAVTADRGEIVARKAAREDAMKAAGRRWAMGLAISAFVSLALAIPVAAEVGPRGSRCGGRRTARRCAHADDRCDDGRGGARRTLGGSAWRAPRVLIFADFTCRRFAARSSLSRPRASARRISVPGRDFRLVVIGLDPKDGADDARTMKHNQIGDGALATAATFLIPNSEELRQIADVVGYRYRPTMPVAINSRIRPRSLC